MSILNLLKLPIYLESIHSSLKACRVIILQVILQVLCDLMAWQYTLHYNVAY